MATFSPRERIRFTSGDAECDAWHYRGTNRACVLMAGGFGVPKGPGTDRFAARFHAAGFSVLAFDFRRLGDSGGEPRLVLGVADQLADWDAAIVKATTLPGVDPNRLALWAFSLSGGEVLEVASRHPELAAAIAQSPNADGPASSRNAAKYTTRRALARLTGRALHDTIRGWFGRSPMLLPLTGASGQVALLSTPDALDGVAVLDPDGSYPDWQPAVAARSALRVGLYRPGRSASRIKVPLLVVAADDDRTALSQPSVRAAEQAPRGELLRIAGGHYAPFLDEHERVVAAELDFLRRHLVSSSSANSSITSSE